MSIGPPPDWTNPLEFETNVPAQVGHPVTGLLLLNHVHSGLHAYFSQNAVRLETMEAVQVQSQWRLEFDPRKQTVVIHWIRVRRGNSTSDRAAMERFRVIQREEQLEACVLHGWFTLLLVLDDVRPGDIIESCYTVTSPPDLMPEVVHAFFGLPAAPVAKFSYALRCPDSAERKRVRWKAWKSGWAPAEDRIGNELLFKWEGGAHVPPKFEPDTPSWHNPSPWVQFSNCDDWDEVSAAIAELWERQNHSPELAEALLSEVKNSSDNSLNRLERAIRIVQDEFRYLSVNWERGGLIPGSPGEVAGRRYGDCKELSWLLVYLLNGLGARARPLLVNTGLLHELEHYLPSPGIFNHAIVEFEWEGQRRWIDPTFQRQGGTALTRVVPNYGVALAVDKHAPGLSRIPGESMDSGTLEIHETVLLDTAGSASIVSVITRATGLRADALRRDFETIPLDQVARDRLQNCANRYMNATRSGELRHHYDLDCNEFVVSEEFEVTGFLQRAESPDHCDVPLPSNIPLRCLFVPDLPRYSPLALPYPCHVIHRIEIDFDALPPSEYKREEVISRHLEFTRSHRLLYRSWTTTFELHFKSSFVRPEEIAEHRKTIESIREKSTLVFSAPLNYPHSRRRHELGKLPQPRSDASGTAQNREIGPKVRVTTTESTGVDIPLQQQPVSRDVQAQPRFVPPVARPSPRRRRKHKRLITVGLWIVGAGLFIALNVLIAKAGTKYRRAQNALALANHSTVTDAAPADDLDLNADAAFNLIRGDGVRRDPAAGIDRLRRGVQQGHVPSMTMMAEVLLVGTGVPKDIPAAVELLHKAAELGHAPAQTMLAKMTFLRETSLCSTQQALAYLQAAAQQQWPPAMASMAIAHHHGLLQPSDKQTVDGWLAKGVALHDPQAQMMLALRLMENGGHVTNGARIAELLQSSAAQGYPPGQTALGAAYAKGDVLPLNLVEALKWYELAGAGGEPTAKANREALSLQLTADEITDARRRASNFRAMSFGMPSHRMPATNSAPRNARKT